MSTNERTLPPAKPPRWIFRLVVGNIVVALIGALLTSFASGSMSPLLTSWRAIFLGFVFGQASLLGIWGALGPNPWWMRWMAVVVGARYLATLLGETEGAFPQFYLLSPFFAFMVATTFVALPLLAVRLVNVAIHRPPSPGAPAGRIQFSIRHLLILIFCVACLISLGKLVAAHLPDGDLRVLFLYFLLINSVAFSLVGGFSVWFVLATKRPKLYGVGWVAVVICADLCLARYVPLYRGLFVTPVAAITMIASLLIVRSRGYRLGPFLVGRMVQAPTPSDADERFHSHLAAVTAAVSSISTRLRFLILAHVVFGLALGLVMMSGADLGPDPAVQGFGGIVFSQVNLFGIWGSLGTSPWRYRLLGVSAGLGWLGLWAGVCTRESPWETFAFVLLVTLLTTGVLLVVRGCRVRICVPVKERRAAPRKQFTLRHLLVPSFAAVCLWSLRDWLLPRMTEVAPPALVLATIGLLSVWPALGARRPVLPSILLIGVAAGVGFCVFEMPLFTAISALSLVASLLVARSCGYRLVRLPEPSETDSTAGPEVPEAEGSAYDIR